jgi:2-polyprenyl-3-methyl-5-hydroxy-6-metoxy-1,4-benzoquinol methylase
MKNKIKDKIRNILSPTYSVLKRIEKKMDDNFKVSHGDKTLDNPSKNILTKTNHSDNTLDNPSKNILTKTNLDDNSYYKNLIENIFPVKERYVERLAVGYNNVDDKIERRVKNGLPFEFENMFVINKAISKFVNSKAKKIINIGGGTGLFEENAAKIFPDKTFFVNEFDLKCYGYFKEKNPNLTNVNYISDSFEDLNRKHGKFDLAVSVEVIEHVDSYKDFLVGISSLADTAIITTPNKMRTYYHLHKTTPDYYQHTREWTPGEFYWVLKMFYEDVELYGINGWESSDIFGIGLFSTCETIIAHCNNKY